MDKNGYVVLLAGVGYLGYNLAYNHIQDGEEVLIISRRRSIEKRPNLFQRLRNLGAKFFIDHEITPETVKNALERFGQPNLIYYLAGINRGTTDEMKYVHGTLSYRIAWKIFGEGIYRGRYIHISAYNPGIVLSGYIESKIYGEKLMMKLKKMGYPITILRPGLLVGRYPYHPEWRQMYQLAKLGVTIQTDIIAGYTPIKELYEFIRYLEEKNIFLDRPIDLTIYRYDIGLISRVFAEQMGHRDPITIKIWHPKSLWKILPYKGSLGFLRGFLYPHDPPPPHEVYRTGFRPRTDLIEELRHTFNDLASLR